MRRLLVCFILFAVNTCYAFTATEQFILTEKYPHTANRTLLYMWQSPAGNQHRLSFTLKADQLINATRQNANLFHFSKHTQQAVNEYSRPGLEQWLSENKLPANSLGFSADGVRFHSQDPKLQQEFITLSARLMQQAISSYQFTACRKLGLYWLQDCLNVDYAKVLAQQQAGLNKVAQAISAQFDEQPGYHLLRNKLEYITSFIQSIPYVENNTEFNSPLSVLLNHRGDCDELSLLAYQLIKSLAPEAQPRLLVVQRGDGYQHMLVLVRLMPRQENEAFFSVMNRIYMPIELTQSTPIGVIPDRIQMALNQGHSALITID